MPRAGIPGKVKLPAMFAEATEGTDTHAISALDENVEAFKSCTLHPLVAELFTPPAL